MEDIQEVERIVEGLQKNKEEPNEKTHALNESPGEGKQEVERTEEDIHANVEGSGDEICRVSQGTVEGQQEDLQSISEESNEKICELSESLMEDQELPANAEVSNKKTCALGQTQMEDQQQKVMVNAEESNVVVEVVPNSGIVIDASGEPFEDNITDCVRREPIFCDIDSDSESVSSSLSVSSLSSFSSAEDISDPNKRKKTRTVKSTKTKGELGIEDLPPVETLTISVPEDDMTEIGTVYCTVDQLVVVESFMNSPALDFDSVLFLSHGKPLGNIFEVFGPVKQPYYLIRFNSNEEIVESGIAKDDRVFYAPTHSDITGFIFTETLMKQKGSDASWEHNNEPPEEHLDFSDDEKERAARRRIAAKNRKTDISDDSVIPKRASLPVEAESDGASDVSRISSSSSYSYHHQRRKTDALTSYSSRTILKPPSRLGFRTHEERVNQGADFTPQHRIPRDFSFFQPRPHQPLQPPQTPPLQQSPMPPSSLEPHAGRQALNQNPGFTLQDRNFMNFSFQARSTMQPPTPEFRSHSEGFNQNTAATPQDRISGNFMFSRPPQQIPPSSVPPTSMRFPPLHEGVNQNGAVTLQDRVPGNFSSSQVHPQIPPSPVPPTSMGFPRHEGVGALMSQDRVLGNFSSSQLPPQIPPSPVPPTSMGFPRHEGFGAVTPQDRVLGNFSSSQLPPQIPPSPVPPTTSMGFPRHEGVGAVTSQDRVLGNFSFSQPRPPQAWHCPQTPFQHSPMRSTSLTHHEGFNQNSAIKLENRISGNLFSPGRQPQPGLPQHTSPMPHSNLRFGTHHEGADQNPAVAPRENFFPQPRQLQPPLLQQSLLPPSSPVFRTDHPGFCQNTSVRPQGRIVANFPISQPRLPQPQQTPPPTHSPVPSSSLGCLPYNEGQSDRIPGNLFPPPRQPQPPPPQHLWMPRF